MRFLKVSALKMILVWFVGRTSQISYLEICLQIQKIIREALLSVHCASKYDFLLRGDQKIVIKELDWELVGLAVRNRLDNIRASDRAIFPIGSKFWFLLKKFGGFMNYFELCMISKMIK